MRKFIKKIKGIFKRKRNEIEVTQGGMKLINLMIERENERSSKIISANITYSQDKEYTLVIVRRV